MKIESDPNSGPQRRRPASSSPQRPAVPPSSQPAVPSSPFPVPGRQLPRLPPDEADAYYRIQELVRELSYAGNEAARRYLNGEIDAAAAAAWLERYALVSPAVAKQRVGFIDKYRSYVINYNLGQDLVRQYVERTAGPNATADTRWKVFSALLASPRLPSGLQ
jgi:hypothetical protein